MKCLGFNLPQCKSPIGSQPNCEGMQGPVILITGTTGNIGSHILAQLLSDDRISVVYALNRASTTRTDRLRSAFVERVHPTPTQPFTDTQLGHNSSAPTADYNPQYLRKH